MKKFASRTLLTISIICNILKKVCPFLACAYFITWVIRLINVDLFNKIDKFLGHLPSYLDKFIPQSTVDIFGMSIPVGYLYAAVVAILVLFIAMSIELSVLDLKRKVDAIKDKSKTNLKKIIEEEKIETIKNIQNQTNFYGLLKFKLSYIDSLNKDRSSLDKLENEYLKMITNKLSEKYTDMIFEQQENGVFIVSHVFEVFDMFLSDVLKLYKILIDLDNKKHIRTEILASFASGSENTREEYFNNLLGKINDLNYLNKIIVIDKFIKKYDTLIERQYEMMALGVSKIEICETKEVDVDMCYLKKN